MNNELSFDQSYHRVRENLKYLQNISKPDFYSLVKMNIETLNWAFLFAIYDIDDKQTKDIYFQEFKNVQNTAMREIDRRQ